MEQWNYDNFWLQGGTGLYLERVDPREWQKDGSLCKEEQDLKEF